MMKRASLQSLAPALTAFAFLVPALTALALLASPGAGAAELGFNAAALGGVNGSSSPPGTNAGGGAAVGAEFNLKFDFGLQVGAEYLYLSQGLSHVAGHVDYFLSRGFYLGALSGTEINSSAYFIAGGELGYDFEVTPTVTLGPKLEIYDLVVPVGIYVPGDLMIALRVKL